MKIGLIGGTGFYDLFDSLQEMNIRTEYGHVILCKGNYHEKEVYFLPRHGKSHHTLAPNVNYRANMLALKQVGVDRILAVSAVGSINPEISIGSLSLLSQFIDFTRRRDKSYGKISVDMTEPFCSDLRENLIQSAQQKNICLFPDATLICVDGPVYETRSELQLYGSWGMDVVGMTNATEAILARELGICFSVVTLSTDMATGFASVPPDLTTHKQVAEQNKGKVKELFLAALSNLKKEKNCNCQEICARAQEAH